MTQPSNETIAEILERLIRRLKAKDTMLVAHRVQQSPPERAFQDVIATNGVEAEATQLVKLLKKRSKQ